MPVTYFRESLNDCLLQGIGELDMNIGVVARIENNSYEIVAVKASSGAFVTGEKFTLGDSLNREVFVRQEVVAISSIDDLSLSLPHPLYRALPLSTFIGAPITLHGDPWGCIDFSSMAQRDKPFSKRDIDLVESLARQVSETLAEAASIRELRATP